MELPAIELPKIELPFDIPVLIHPAVDHFAIALPVVILLIEFYNLFARKKSVGGFSFILIFLVVVVMTAAYFTGLVDGKESFDLLSAEGQEELKEHKLLGTYLLLASGVLLFFKLLAMTGKSFFKFLFFLVLIGFIVLTFIQGKDGGELVFEHGANVERVKVLDDKLFDANDMLEELQSKQAPKAEESVVQPEVVETVESKPEVNEETPVSIPTPEPKVEEAVKPAETQELPTPQMPEANPKVEALLENAKQEMEEISQKAISTAEGTGGEVIEVAPTEVERPTIRMH